MIIDEAFIARGLGYQTDKPLPEPGIYPDMQMDEYLALPLMSASGIENIRKSPKQYLHAKTTPKKRTSALERGTGLHLAVLEPVLFDSQFVVSGPCDELLKSGARKGEPCGVNGSYLHERLGWLCGTHVKGAGPGIRSDIEIISVQTHADVIGMRDAIRAHKRAASLFEGAGSFETTIVFDDPDTGVRCKIRPDRLVKRAGMNVDIKTTVCAQEWAFSSQAEKLGYFRKLALYRRGLRAVGWPYKETAVLAIESAAPYDLVPYLLDEKDLDSADIEVTRALREYKTCEELGVFPGYTEEFKMLSRPKWASAQEDA
jgi:hypothetical protein